MRNAVSCVSPTPRWPGAACSHGKNVRMVPGLALLVAVIKVIGARIVEIHGLLDQPQPERAGVEVEIAVGAARNGRNVMDAGHGPLPVTGTLYWAVPAARQTLQSSLAPRQRWAREGQCKQALSVRSGPCRRRCGATFQPSATTRRCAVRARSCRPCASARRATEDARMLIRENEQLLHETGLFRFHQPKTFGGMELDFVAIFDIPAEIARGCPSTAWNVGNLATHHWMLGFYEPETQHEVWDANPDALIASSIALAAGRGRKVDGGFEVTGRWPFSSGVDNSDWNMLAVTVYDGDKAVDWRLCLVPEDRLRDHRHLVRHGHVRHRQQGHRREGAVRAGTPRARTREHPRRLRAPRRRAPSRRAVRYPDHRRGRHPALARLDRRRGGRLRAFRRNDGASAPAPIRARRSPTSRRCRSSLPAHVC